jgi:hypothetical protein
MSENKKELVVNLLVLIWLPIYVVLCGYLFSKLFLWFVVPFGVAPIGIAHSLGLTMMYGFITTKYDDYKKAQKRTTEEKLDIISYNIGFLICTLLFGMLYHYFM